MCSSTTLDVTLHGGFGYVVDPDLAIEAGFMKSSATPSCDVPQFGANLRIDDGKIVSPPNHATTFPVTQSVVTFDGTGTSPVTLTGVLAPHMKSAATGGAKPGSTTLATLALQGPGSGTRPMPGTNEDDWRDLYWMPHTRLNYWDDPIDPNWPTNAVTGRVKLTGGVLSAGIPSDGAAVNGLWEFKTTSGKFPSYQQAITDRLHYRSQVSGGTITINVMGPMPETIVVAPIDNRKTVGIVIVGIHGGDSMPIGLNDPLKHFCTFYQMLKIDNRPGADDQLIPYFKGAGTTSNGAPTVPSGGQPTPGAYCPGDWP